MIETPALCQAAVSIFFMPVLKNPTEQRRILNNLNGYTF